MYPEAIPLVRDAIKRRYELIPYTYSLALKSHVTAVPPQRWTGWGYESDPEVWTGPIKAGDTQYWFGDALLIAGVYEPGHNSARVYLPRKQKLEDDSEDSDNDNAADENTTDFGFLNTHAPYQHLESGKWHDIHSEWKDSIPVLARCGSAVPVGKNRPTASVEDAEFPGMDKDDWRGVEIFPPPNSSNDFVFENSWLEDDGISCEAPADRCEVRLSYKADTAIALEATLHGKWKPLWLPHGLDIILPVGEERTVVSMSPHEVTDKGKDTQGRRMFCIEVNTTSEI
jgi:hypothetical protein